jgi:hypothetical protein
MSEGNPSSKVQIKMEQIARLRVSAMADTRVAQIVGISYGGLQRIIALKEYKDLERIVREAVVGKMDDALERRRIDVMKASSELQDAVPDALRFIIETAKQGKDLRARLIASKELLDRDPNAAFCKSITKARNPDGQVVTGQLPEQVIEQAKREAERAAEVLLQVPTKVANA